MCLWFGRLVVVACVGCNALCVVRCIVCRAWLVGCGVLCACILLCFVCLGLVCFVCVGWVAAVYCCVVVGWCLFCVHLGVVCVVSVSVVVVGLFGFVWSGLVVVSVFVVFVVCGVVFIVSVSL